MLSSWRWSEIPTVAWTSGRWLRGERERAEEIESLGEKDYRGKLAGWKSRKRVLFRFAVLK
jgi:hypothetical protein